jgi:hypothetical protein
LEFVLVCKFPLKCAVHLISHHLPVLCEEIHLLIAKICRLQFRVSHKPLVT